jgi:hypothetical protein
MLEEFFLIGDKLLDVNFFLIVIFFIDPKFFIFDGIILFLFSFKILNLFL